ncbi:nucleotidyltransferase domain-containing protein [Fibrella aquatilis]|uniref:Nucleotidyltransferase domain-containing protein n=1 Tax=Fibrella aquatilis TaxID=2817059 RepID=A0A939G7T8_9BACT|nr:nucleotidyltransferase domain-containing protein [Fibrella aquatilis]MBO0931742.1 nucleotidyltransferase domain-containing protein [Fibrella aquatilis]
MNSTSLKPLSEAELGALSQQLKRALLSIYGPQLDRLILFGSYARGDFRSDSDVDYLVVLKQDTVHFGPEVDKISIVASQLGLDYTVHVSAKPVSATAYNQSTRLFYQAVRSEGIVV